MQDNRIRFHKLYCSKNTGWTYIKEWFIIHSFTVKHERTHDYMIVPQKELIFLQSFDVADFRYSENFQQMTQ